MHRHPAEAGFALLIVLWALVLLTLLTSELTASARSEVKLSGNLRDATLAEAAADGAAQEAIFRLVAGQWTPGATAYRLRLGDAVVMVRIQDEAGLINPNNAPVALLAALLREVGAAVPTAQALATEMAQFSNAGGADPSAYIAAGLPYGPALRNFRDVAELRLLPGMTPELYARVAPYLSVWKSPAATPDAADPIVAAAYRAAGPGATARRTRSPSYLQAGDNLLVVRITAIASVGGGRFTRIGELRVFGQSGNQPRPPMYQIMSWHASDD